MKLPPLKKEAARGDKQPSRDEVWEVRGQLRGGKKGKTDRRERKHSWPYVCSFAVQSVASQFCWPPQHAPSPHHSTARLEAQQPPPQATPLLLPLLPKQPHEDSSDRPTTSYLSAGTGSFMSAGHRFNTRPRQWHDWWPGRMMDGLPVGRSCFCCLTGRLFVTALRSLQRDEPESDSRKCPRTLGVILISWLAALMKGCIPRSWE